MKKEKNFVPCIGVPRVPYDFESADAEEAIRLADMTLKYILKLTAERYPIDTEVCRLIRRNFFALFASSMRDLISCEEGEERENNTSDEKK